MKQPQRKLFVHSNANSNMANPPRNCLLHECVDFASTILCLTFLASYGQSCSIIQPKCSSRNAHPANFLTLSKSCCLLQERHQSSESAFWKLFLQQRMLQDQVCDRFPVFPVLFQTITFSENGRTDREGFKALWKRVKPFDKPEEVIIANISLFSLSLAEIDDRECLSTLMTLCSTLLYLVGFRPMKFPSSHIKNQAHFLSTHRNPPLLFVYSAYFS